VVVVVVTSVVDVVVVASVVEVVDDVVVVASVVAVVVVGGGPPPTGPHAATATTSAQATTSESERVRRILGPCLSRRATAAAAPYLPSHTTARMVSLRARRRAARGAAAENRLSAGARGGFAVVR
jgi:pyruvate/2-oxoglutarate dehydrogenase complex dihydrolipoamide acyltransferase (E2) component